jgi:hypothetical protein
MLINSYKKIMLEMCLSSSLNWPINTNDPSHMIPFQECLAGASFKLSTILILGVALSNNILQRTDSRLIM